MNLNEVKRRAVRGVAALTGRTAFLQAINWGGFFLLGIFLDPSAIGVYFVVSALMRIFNLFTDLGFGAALVQKKDEPDNEDLKTVFTVQEILVTTAILVGILATPIIKRWANLDPGGVLVYYALLASLFFSSLKAISSILLERKLAFGKQVVPQIIEAVVFNVVVVFSAWKGLGVASYSLAVVLSAAIGVPVYFWLSPWKLSLGINRDKMRTLVSYGLKFQGKSFLAVLKDDLLMFLLSGWVGTAGIGYFGWAQKWAFAPFRLVVDSVTKVTFPAYSRLQHSLEDLKASLEQSVFTVAALLFPVFVVMGFSIKHFIHLVPKYEKWEIALPSLYILMVSAAASSISNILVNVLDATGRVGTTLKLMVFWIVVTWFATLGAVMAFGFTGIAMGSLLVSSTLIVTVYLVKRVVNFEFWQNIFAPLTASLALCVLYYFFGGTIPVTWMGLAIKIVLGVIIYFGLIFLLAHKKLSKWLSYLLPS